MKHRMRTSGSRQHPQHTQPNDCNGHVGMAVLVMVSVLALLTLTGTAKIASSRVSQPAFGFNTSHWRADRPSC